MLDPRFAILGAALVVLGELAYVVDVLRHQVRPNRVSWAVWTVPPLVCFIAQVDAGVGAASLLSLGMGIGALLVLLASFRNRHAYARLGPLDWSCALLAAVSAVIWAATNDVNTTVITVGAIDWLAALPIFVKAYRSPSSESGHSFLLCAL